MKEIWMSETETINGFELWNKGTGVLRLLKGLAQLNYNFTDQLFVALEEGRETMIFPDDFTFGKRSQLLNILKIQR